MVSPVESKWKDALGCDAEKHAALPTAKAARVARPGWGLGELGTILRLGWPITLNLFLCFIPGLAMLAFLKHDAQQLAAAGMGFMFSNVSGISLLIGAGSGISPLVSQAFGAGNFKRCGDILQRQFAIHIVVVLLVGAIWLNTENILVALRQPAAVARLAGEFVCWRIPALPFFALKEDVTNYLMAQQVMIFPMVIGAVSNLANIAVFPAFIGWFGFAGAPLAITLANAAQALLTLLLARRALPRPEAWPRWSLRAALAGWGEVLRMSLPSAVMMLSEWWGWETNLFFAGLLCERGALTCLELDVFPIVSNTMVVAFMCQYGFCLASGTIVGNALGEGDAGRARRTAHVTLLLVSAITGAVSIVLVGLRWHWAAAFSDEAAVIELSARVLPLVALYVFLDALGPGALVSVLRAMGIVKLPAAITFIAFYVVGIPCGLLLTFGRRSEGWGIQGLWAGLVLAMFTMVSSLLVYLLRCINWQQAAVAVRAQALRSAAGVQVEGRVVGKKAAPYEPVADVEAMASKPQMEVA